MDAWSARCRARPDATPAGSKQSLDCLAGHVAEVGPLQGEGDVGAEKADFVAAVIGHLGILHGVEALVLHQSGHGATFLGLRQRD